MKKTSSTGNKWLAIGTMAASLYAVGNMFHPTMVLGDSMAPTLKSGRWIWINRTHYGKRAPRPGEVVVFRMDGRTYVKRVYRGPGEEIHYVAHGSEWLGPVREGRVNELAQRYTRPRSYLRVKHMRVPDDSIFVLGDNYLRSIDSRQLGPIPISCIIGRAWLPADTTSVLTYEYAPRSYRRGPAARRDHAAVRGRVQMASRSM